jgi:multiple sugar transport system ATP-binding protein
MADIRFNTVSKSYNAQKAIISDLDLQVVDGEFLVLVGPSGSGKSSALRMIAGLESVTSGSISIAGRDVTALHPKDRDIAMVFQNYALYPHKTVRQNMSFSLELAKVPQAERERRVNDVARILGLEPYLDRKPSHLSGGQRQRVAMGRAIVREPKAFLMDEPLSNLDAKLRVSMRAAISALHKRLGVTTVYVTHDQVEAMTLGDRVAVLHEGRLQQIGTPETLFERPANVFVAGFIGAPSMNFASARLIVRDGIRLVFGNQEIELPSHVAGRFGDLSGYVGKEVILGIRPHNLHRSDAPSDLDAIVNGKESLGTGINIHFSIDAAPPAFIAQTDAGHEQKEEEAIVSSSLGGSIWSASLGARENIAAGDRIHLRLDREGLNLFDAETGTSLLESSRS